jgi:hypothetical protein
VSDYEITGGTWMRGATSTSSPTCPICNTLRNYMRWQ